MHTISHLRPVLLSGAAAVAGVSIAGCGGSSVSHSFHLRAAQAKFASCVRAHGVPSYSDSGSVSAGANTNTATARVGGTAVSPAVLKSAAARCIEAAPYFQDSPMPSPAQLTSLTARSPKFDACIRAHGVPDYPDPRVEAGVDGHGVVGKAPKSSFRGPFTKAMSVCSHLLNPTSVHTTG